MQTKLNTPIDENRRAYILQQLKEAGYPVTYFQQEQNADFTLFDLLNFYDKTCHNEIHGLVDRAMNSKLDGLIEPLSLS